MTSSDHYSNEPDNMRTSPLAAVYRLYGIKNCDTVKKACLWLDSHGIPYRFMDYKSPGLVASHLPDWHARTGWRRLLNTRSQTWKKLQAPPLETLDDATALQLLIQHPTLIKRPPLDIGSELIIGFDLVRYQGLEKHQGPRLPFGKP